MFIIECHICQTTHLGTARSVQAIRRTDQGNLATVICPEGHTTTHLFARPNKKAELCLA